MAETEIAVPKATVGKVIEISQCLTGTASLMFKMIDDVDDEKLSAELSALHLMVSKSANDLDDLFKDY